MIEGLPAIAPWELVYMYTFRTHDGKLLRRLLWTDGGDLHAANLPTGKAETLGLDIYPDSRLCQVWGVVEGIIILAMGENLRL